MSVASCGGGVAELSVTPGCSSDMNTRVLSLQIKPCEVCDVKHLTQQHNHQPQKKIQMIDNPITKFLACCLQTFFQGKIFCFHNHASE